MKKIFIVIINYNGQKNTLDCLNSLEKIKHESFSVNTIIVDNDSENRINIQEKEYPRLNIKIIFSSKNLGFSGGNNLGINEAIKNSADYILILNNDTLVKSDFLDELFNFAEKNKDAGIIAPKIYFAKGFEFHKDKYEEKDLGRVIWYAGGVIDWNNIIGGHIGVDEVDQGQFDKTCETELVSGCCMFISVNALKKVGFFDEKYFLYYEDVDLCVRIKSADFKIYYLPSSVIWHKNAGSTGGSGSTLQDYYITRNRLLFGFKHASIRAKFALLREGIRLVINGRQMQKRGVKDFILLRFGKSRNI